MYSQLLIFVAIICNFSVYCQTNNVELAREFLFHKNLKTGVFFTCESKHKQIRLLKDLKEMFLLISIKEPSKLNSSLFNYTMNSSFTYSAVVIDLNCTDSMYILKLASKYRMFTSNYYWLVFGKEQLNASIEGVLYENEIILSIESEVIWVKYDVTMVALFDVYQTGIRPYGQTCIISLTTNTTHNWNHRKWKLDKRTNLHNLKLNATSVVKPNTGTTANSDRSELQNEQEIIKYLTDYKNAHSNSMSKFYWAVCRLVQKQFNFTVRIVPTSSWGYKWNGTFDGMVALLSNGSADIAATGAIIRKVRLEFIDYVGTQIWPFQQVFLLRNPQQTGTIRDIFLRPLSNDTWICVFTTIILAFTVMRLSSWLLGHFHLPRGDDSWSGSVIMILSAVCQQGSSIIPRQLGYRILFLFLFLWAMLIYQFYTSSIVSALLSAIPQSIRNLADLAHSNLHIGFEDLLTSKDAFTRFRWNQNLQMIYEKHVASKKNKVFYSPKEGVDCLKQGMFAFYVDPASANHLIEETFSDSEICDLREVYLAEKEFLAVPIQKHSPYKKLLTYGIRKAINSGMIKREVLRWNSRKPICRLTSRTRHRPVDLVETSPAFLLLFTGILVSIFILFAEITYFRYTNC